MSKNNKPAKNTNYPMTAGMEEILMDCHERELMKMDPLMYGTAKSTAALIARGLITLRQTTKPNGQRIYALYTTQLGRSYLRKFCEN